MYSLYVKNMLHSPHCKSKFLPVHSVVSTIVGSDLSLMLSFYLYNVVLFRAILPHPPDPVTRVDGHHLGFKPLICHVDGVILE